MKTIYLNSDFECSVTEKEDTVQSIKTDYFDGKCNAFIEGYRYLPKGNTWTSKDGTVFTGEMIVPFKDFTQLEMIQAVYHQLAEDIALTQLAVAQLYESGVTAND